VNPESNNLKLTRIGRAKDPKSGAVSQHSWVCSCLLLPLLHRRARQ
jgi:hypothetical protein